ncbi:alpha/beta fold hydrolase [Brumimicrobium aurantiacum]|uniref:Alpha/beta hydrolase n=1 Tax=Brumimicrobium aurantiacum TaxID=1737063 RepID=A0A3E1EX24_9FLAO|nr:alpha/beta hydrolase [Brumimicrobium aurantiacum]RFC54110.1 alpha/beta hydrolase [Brumimicrobium aurantiacum]
MRLLLFIPLFFLFMSCSGKYDKYKKTPEYISKASNSKEAYYNAYNETLKLWSSSFEELYIPTTYGIAHVIVSGPKKADPVVLLHGMNASSTMWYPNIESLSEDHRVFAIDFILEPGKSHLNHDIESIEEVNDWYEDVILALELENYHLIGASKGGWLATKLALNNKKNIKSLILLSPAQTFTWIKPSKDLFKNIAMIFSSEEKRIEQNLESMSSNSDLISDTYIKQYKLGLEIAPKNKFMSSMRPFSNEELMSLKMPVLVLIGDEDMLNNESTIEKAIELSHGKGEIIQNAGHFLSIDQSETVNEKMVTFLKGDN